MNMHTNGLATGLEGFLIDSLTPFVAKNIDIKDLKGSHDFLINLIQENSPVLHIKLDQYNETVKLDCVHHKFKELMQHVRSQEPIFLTGPAGSGKSILAEQVSKALKLNFGSISVCAQTTKTDFLGYCDAHGKYIKTSFRDIYENGGVFLIDEIDAGNPNVLSVLNAALSNTFFSFPDGLVKKHDKFLLIATANTLGKGSSEYIGRNQLDAATLDRFNFIFVDYDTNLEKIIVPNKFVNQLGKIHKIRNFILNKNIKIIVSTRSIIKIVKLLDMGIDFDEALKATIFKSSNPDDIRDILDNIKD